MLIVQHPMQFSGPPRNISNLYVRHYFAQTNGGSTNTTRVHAFYALLLHSKHYQIMPYLLHGRRPDIQNFTMTEN